MFNSGFVYNSLPHVIYVTRVEKYLNKKEVMEYITVKGYPTVNKFLKSGNIKAIDTPMGKRFKKSEIDKYMESFPRSYAN